jgi:hypothetical protein
VRARAERWGRIKINSSVPESVGANSATVPNSVPVSLIPGRRRVSAGRARRPSSPLRRARGLLPGEKGQPRQAFGKCTCLICFWLLALPRIGWERDLMACHSLMICLVGMEYLRACPRCRLLMHESLHEPLAGAERNMLGLGRPSGSTAATQSL